MVATGLKSWSIPALFGEVLLDPAGGVLSDIEEVEWVVEDVIDTVGIAETVVGRVDGTADHHSLGLVDLSIGKAGDAQNFSVLVKHREPCGVQLK